MIPFFHSWFWLLFDFQLSFHNKGNFVFQRVLLEWHRIKLLKSNVFIDWCIPVFKVCCIAKYKMIMKSNFTILGCFSCYRYKFYKRVSASTHRTLSTSNLGRPICVVFLLACAFATIPSLSLTTIYHAQVLNWYYRFHIRIAVFIS